MPDNLRDVLCNHFVETYNYLMIGASFWNQMPSVAKKSIDGKIARDLESVVQQFEILDSPYVEGSDFAVDGGASITYQLRRLKRR